MIAALYVSIVLTAALCLALGRAIGRREQPPQVRPRTVHDAIAECSNVYELRPGRNRKRSAKN